MSSQDSKDRIIRRYIRFGDRQVKMSASINDQIKAQEEKLRNLDKSDISENSDYDDVVSRLQTLYYNSSKYKYWARYYVKFREQLLKKLEDDYIVAKNDSIITAGSVVKVRNEASSYELLIVPAHLGNKVMMALGVDSKLGEALLSKKAGDEVTLKLRNITYKIEEVY